MDALICAFVIVVALLGVTAIVALSRGGDGEKYNDPGVVRGYRSSRLDPGPTPRAPIPQPGMYATPGIREDTLVDEAVRLGGRIVSSWDEKREYGFGMVEFCVALFLAALVMYALVEAVSYFSFCQEFINRIIRGLELAASGGVMMTWVPEIKGLAESIYFDLESPEAGEKLAELLGQLGLVRDSKVEKGSLVMAFRNPKFQRRVLTIDVNVYYGHKGWSMVYKGIEAEKIKEVLAQL